MNIKKRNIIVANNDLFYLNPGVLTFKMIIVLQNILRSIDHLKSCIEEGSVAVVTWKEFYDIRSK